MYATPRSSETSDEAKFVHYLLKKEASDDVFIPKQTKEFTIDLEESLKKFDRILCYFLWCKQDYSYRELLTHSLEFWNFWIK